MSSGKRSVLPYSCQLSSISIRSLISADLIREICGGPRLELSLVCQRGPPQIDKCHEECTGFKSTTQSDEFENEKEYTAKLRRADDRGTSDYKEVRRRNCLKTYLVELLKAGRDDFEPRDNAHLSSVARDVCMHLQMMWASSANTSNV